MERIIGIKSDSVPDFWHYVKDMLEKSIAVSKGNYTSESVYEDLINQHQQLWLLVDDESKKVLYAGTTKIDVYEEPKRKIAHIMFVGGAEKTNRPAYLDFGQCIYDWAKSQNCDYMLTYTRKGSARLMKRMGWQKVTDTEYGVLMLKDLDND